MNYLNDIVKEKIGFTPEKSVLKIYNDKLWNDFLKAQKFDDSTKGVYSPKDYTAHINDSSESLVAFHEFYGHGTFCEHSMIGQKLVNAIKNNENIDETYKKTYFYNEGFALWMESFLAKQLNMKYDNQDSKLTYANHCESISDFFLKREFGFPQKPTLKDAKEVIESLYDVNDIKLAIVYGSQKPTSDLDFFIVSDNIETQVTHWLDIYAVNTDYFITGINNLLIDVTDPLFSGQAIIGRREFEQAKEYVTSREITNEAIKMNVIASKHKPL